jgi:hypothetical protein
MNMRDIFKLVILSCLVFVFGFAAEARAQEGETRGNVTSGDFASASAAAGQMIANRRKTSSGASAASGRVQGPVYKKKKTPVKPVVKPKPKPAPKPAEKVNFGYEEIGVTIWKLRKKLPNETTPAISTFEKGVKVEYVPERVNSDTPLKLGDKVRITIESPRNGYLYIVDSEKYQDNTFGKPILIFPTKRTRGGNNYVSAGVLVDIPAQDDDTPYFVINSDNPGYAGEVLRVVVSRDALKGVTVPDRALSVDRSLLDGWSDEWETEADVFEQENGSGKEWTDAEKEAGQVNGRALTQEDPTPQTIYRVWTDKRKPFLVSVGWTVSN